MPKSQHTIITLMSYNVFLITPSRIAAIIDASDHDCCSYFLFYIRTHYTSAYIYTKMKFKFYFLKKQCKIIVGKVIIGRDSTNIEIEKNSIFHFAPQAHEICLWNFKPKLGPTLNE